MSREAKPTPLAITGQFSLAEKGNSSFGGGYVIVGTWSWHIHGSVLVLQTGQAARVLGTAQCQGW